MSRKKNISDKSNTPTTTRKEINKRLSKTESSRRAKFALEYAMNGSNGTQAYLNAGYNCTLESASVSAHRLLRNAKVVEEIRKYKQVLHERIMMSKEEVLQETAELATFDPINMLDENGNLLPLQEMDAATRKGINEMEIEQTADGVKIGKIKSGRDKRAAIDMLNKHYNSYEDHQKDGANKELKIYLMYPEDALA